jgi:hypothetical protein
MDREPAPVSFFDPGTAIEELGRTLAAAREHPSGAAKQPTANASDRARRRRMAAKLRGGGAHILVCERAARGPVCTLIKRLRYGITTCPSLEQALNATTSTPVDLAVIVTEQDLDADVGLLQLLRRALPRTPFVLVLDNPTPAARLATLTVRPFYVAVPPIGAEEMAAVIRDGLALARKHR